MGIPVAYAEAVEAVGRTVGVKPLPAGINVADVGDWTLVLNASGKAVQHEGQPIAPWSVLCLNNVYFAFGFFDPTGGMIGGYSEDQFIADLKAGALSPSQSPETDR